MRLGEEPAARVVGEGGAEDVGSVPLDGDEDVAGEVSGGGGARDMPVRGELGCLYEVPRGVVEEGALGAAGCGGGAGGEHGDPLAGEEPGDAERVGGRYAVLREEGELRGHAVVGAAELPS